MQQGLGPFFVRSFLAHGAEIVGFVASSEASVESAARDLLRDHGLVIQGYTALEGLLAEVDVDAIVIAAPLPFHEAALETALAHGKAVLCEKPLLDADPTSPARAAALCARFAEAQLPLVVNAQWPETLAAYWEVSGLDAATVQRFEMELAPGSTHERAIIDSLPHPLSLLQQTAPGEATLENVRIEDLGLGRGLASGHLQRLEFGYVTPTRRIEVGITLAHQAAPPRRAGYGFDGLFARREIEEPGYRMFFRIGDALFADPAWAALRPCTAARTQRISVADPLDQRVARFLAILENGQDPREAFLPAQRMRMLRSVLDAYEAAPVDAAMKRASGGEGQQP